MPQKQRKQLPKELEGVAYLEDVNAIQERLEKCYSSERYEEFQTSVEKIADRYLKSKLGWAVLIWLITLIASMLAQKFLGIF